MSKLILGTAQFGSNYGIKHDGQPSLKEVEKIARTAWDGGVRVIHTAKSYSCKSIIDKYFNEFDRIEKRNEMVYPQWLYWNGRMGYSIYHELDIEKDLEDVGIDFIQMPVNVLDNLFKKILPKLKRYNNPKIEIHARSVFLQGLLLMDPGSYPTWLQNHPEAFCKILEFKNVCLEKTLEPYEAALGYILGLNEVNKIIVGVNSAKQLKQLLQVKPLKWDYDFSITDENVLDPRRWPKS